MKPQATAVGDPAARIAFVGEALGEAERLHELPLVGPTGDELLRMLVEAGLASSHLLSLLKPYKQFGLGSYSLGQMARDRKLPGFFTNVFQLRPPGNNVEEFFCKKADAGAGGQLPPLRSGKYIKEEFLPQLARLHEELAALPKLNLIVAMGATATWAVIGDGRITRVRGTVYATTRAAKCIPMFHPAAILRNWSWRPVTVADLMKAKREGEFPDIRRPRREIWIEPSIKDLSDFGLKYLVPFPKQLSIDIETKHRQITCIGFAPSPKVAICVPFVDERKPGYSYWDSHEDEAAAWDWCRFWLENSNVEKFGQNGVYDLQWLWRKAGIPVTPYADDTMLLHHALQPEMQKGLGFLGSIYTNEAAWKEMRGRFTETKREDS